MFRQIGLAFGIMAIVAWNPVAAQEPIVIGVLDDMAGSSADLNGPSAVAAAQMAIDDFGGTVLGRPVRLISADHRNKPDVGAAIARRWYDQEGVKVIVGLGTSSVALAVRSIARERRTIDINVSAATSDLSGPACSPTGFHWVYDTYSLAKTVGLSVLRTGRQKWFFVTADYTFGQTLQRDTTAALLANGGVVTGSVKVPTDTGDMSSYLLQAQSSGADVIALALAGADARSAIMQAHEFGVSNGKQSVAALLLAITDVHALGLDTAQGLFVAEAFYWDRDDASRAWAKRFFTVRKVMPNMLNAGDYSGVTHYLKAVAAAGTLDAGAVAAKMRELPIEDATTHKGRVREDGRVIRDMYLFGVKSPTQSRYPWDYYTLIATIPGDDAFRPVAEGGCTLAGQ